MQYNMVGSLAKQSNSNVHLVLLALAGAVGAIKTRRSLLLVASSAAAGGWCTKQKVS
jgi:hypothetical protein